MAPRRYSPFLLGSVLLLGSCSDAQPSRDVAASFLELRPASAEQRPDTDALTLNDEMLYVDRTPIISDPDVASIVATVRDDALFLELHLTDAGQSRLSEHTRENMGSRLALIVDSEIRAAPTIASEVESPLLTRISADRATVQRLLTQVRERW